MRGCPGQTHAGPMSNPPDDRMRPLGRSPASSTVTSRPVATRRRASHNPARPPPMMIVLSVALQCPHVAFDATEPARRLAVHAGLTDAPPRNATRRPPDDRLSPPPRPSRSGACDAEEPRHHGLHAHQSGGDEGLEPGGGILCRAGARRRLSHGHRRHGPEP